MIDYVSGEVVELTPTYAIIDVHGIGYQLNISLATYENLTLGKGSKLYAYEVIREDAHLLFGFLQKAEREMFLLLISVSGVGANTARVILSSLSIEEIEQAINTSNSVALKSVKGIGQKTAERIIVDLKGKVTGTTATSALLETVSKQSQIADEAVAALIMLGYAKATATKNVQAILKKSPADSVEAVIKTALKML